MARSYHNNKIVQFKYFDEQAAGAGESSEMRVVLVDAIPHLLTQLLLNTVPKHREHAQLAYKVAFGALQGYLKQAQQLKLPASFVFAPLKKFVLAVLCDTQVAEHSYQHTYACLTLLNMIFIQNAPAAPVLAA